MGSYQEAKQLIRTEVIDKMDFSRAVEDEEVKQMIGDAVLAYSRRNYLTYEEKKKLGKDLFFSIRKLDVLQDLIDNPQITEIMVNGKDCIFYEKNGRLVLSDYHFDTVEKLEDVIQQIVGKCNRIVNEASPIVDARLENGSRVNVVLPPVALNGPILTIRRFPEKPVTMKGLIALGALDEDRAEWLQKLVKAGYNIFISGGTGAGKTTFLNALSDYIPKDERVITIEDSAELQLQGISNLVRMETRNANVEGCKEISIRDLIRTSLRMRPDRIVVGETRGGEALDVLQAMDTGHDGSLSTGHANSARDMLSRLETMVLMGMELPLTAIKRQIASGIDLIIHLGRLRDKSRKVLEIVEILDYYDGEIEVNTLYEFEETGETEDGRVQGRLEKKGKLCRIKKLQAAGLHSAEE